MPSDSDYKEAYASILNNYINMGVRTIDLERDTLRIFEIFGVQNSFFEENLRLIVDFCRGILKIYSKFRQR